MIIFLYGEDSFRGRQKLNELKDKFVREVDPTGGSLSVVDGAKTSLREINEQVGASSLWARKRLVVIEDIFLNKGENIFVDLLEFLEKQVESDNVLIFFDSTIKMEKKYGKEMPVAINSSGETKPLTVKPGKLFKLLASQKFAQEFKALSNTETATWVKKTAEARGAQITLPNAGRLVALSGNNLWQLSNEIDKLISFKSGQAPQLVKDGQQVVIEEGEIEELVSGNFQENIFALTDAISAKNKGLAMKILEEQFSAGSADVYLLVMITRQFRILWQIRQALDAGESQRQMLSALKLHPFVLQKGTAQARQFSADQLKRILNRLTEMDYQLKTGQGEIKSMIDLLISVL